MSQVRSSIELLFGDVVNYFSSLDHKENIKFGLDSDGELYIISVSLMD